MLKCVNNPSLSFLHLTERHGENIDHVVNIMT